MFGVVCPRITGFWSFFSGGRQESGGLCPSLRRWDREGESQPEPSLHPTPPPAMA